MKALEVAEGKALEREEKFKEQVQYFFLDYVLHISEEQNFPVHIFFVSDLDSSQPTKDR